MGKGLEVSPSCLREDYLVQRQIGHDALGALVFCLEFLQPFELITGHAATLFAPAVIGLHRNADLSNGLLSKHIRRKV